ncbi:hypothetical protein WR25_13711 [Diploscapter pachys]|uniref:Uncharacterized protein n=1 Tax=Diploscapter pachys TaxID=2018661 RepID=A0A2A2M575_9BILA|nr:hypothetical protein WR25_13711 [Diploscapter pachys]
MLLGMLRLTRSDSCDSVEIIADSAAAVKEADAEKSAEAKEGDKDEDGEDESGQEQKEEEQANVSVSGRVKKSGKATNNSYSKCFI